MRKPIFFAILVTWLLLSLVPQLGLMALLGKAKGGKGKKG
jgi:hypothetical protein